MVGLIAVCSVWLIAVKYVLRGIAGVRLAVPKGLTIIVFVIVMALAMLLHPCG